MLNLNFDYADCVRNSERVQWTLDEVMRESERLDFSRPFLPASLVQSVAVMSLDEPSQLVLNHIAGNAYLNLFQFVEEYILATMMEHARAELFGDPDAMRALTRMVDEELKHQMLFQRFRRAFDRDFGHTCGVLESASEVAHVIMGHSPMAVLLITLHIEWMTQNHYTESARGDETLDPFFKKLLHHHWLEESQHARIDMLELNKLAAVVDQAGRDKAVDEYLGIIGAFDGLLAQQAELDMQSFLAIRGSLEGVPSDLERSLHQSYRHTFIWFGMVNEKVVQVLEQVSPSGARLVAEETAKYA